MSRFKPDLQRTLAMHRLYWERENHDRPLLLAYAPMPPEKSVPVPRTDDLMQHWLDVDFVISRILAGFTNTYYAADSLPIYNPNIGPDFFGALCGCEIELGWNTSWAKHCVDDLGGYRVPPFDAQNRWWKKTAELTEAGMQASQGDFYVSIADIHAGLDAVVSLRGPENTCFDLVEKPEAVKRVTNEMYGLFEEVIDRSMALTKQQDGITNWLGLWYPSRWYVTSCDAICLLSPQMMDEFVVPVLQKELDFLDVSLFHLDGVQALTHLDALLAQPKLKGIQWVYGAGQPTAAHWIEVLRRIQAAGKCIHVDARPEEIETLCRALRPEGVCYSVHCRSVEDADALVDLSIRASKK